MRRSKTARCSAEVTTCSIVPRRFAARAVLRARPTRRARSPGRSPWPAGRRRVPALAQGHAATREFGSHHHVDAHRATLRRDRRPRRPHARTYNLRAGGSRQRYRGTRASHRRPIAANGRPRRSQGARGGHRAHSLPRSTPGSEPTRSSRTAGRPSRSSNNGSRTGRRRYMNRTPHPTRSMPQRPDSLRRRRPVPD